MSVYVFYRYYVLVLGYMRSMLKWCDILCLFGKCVVLFCAGRAERFCIYLCICLMVHVVVEWCIFDGVFGGCKEMFNVGEYVLACGG